MCNGIVLSKKKTKIFHNTAVFGVSNAATCAEKHLSVTLLPGLAMTLPLLCLQILIFRIQTNEFKFKIKLRVPTNKSQFQLHIRFCFG